MQYQQVDTSTPTTETKGNDIVSHINFLCNSDYLSYHPEDKVRNVNTAYEELVSMIINADGSWEFDDTNHTDAPRGKGDLVEGQEYYTFATDYLQIEAIDVLDADGITYRRVKPLDHLELGGISPDEYYGIKDNGNPETGFPEIYDIKGDSIRLYPAPTAGEVTLTNGLRVWFKRTVNLFTTADTSQVPGLPSTHHELLAYMASVPYCMSFKKDRVGMYENKIFEMKKTLLEHYAFREKNKRGVIKPRRRLYR